MHSKSVELGDVAEDCGVKIMRPRATTAREKFKAEW